MHPFSVRQLILSSSPHVRESNLGSVGFGHAVDSSLVPRPVLAIRVTKGGLEPSSIEYAANFPTSLTGDVTSEIAEDDWERGCVDSRLKVPYSGFFFNGTWNPDPIVRGIPDSRSCFPDSTAKI